MKLLTGTVMALAMASIASYGAPLNGTLNFTGDATVTLDNIDFYLGADPDDLRISASPDFGYTDGQLGAIKDIPTGAVSIPDFLTLPGGVTFTVTEVVAASAGACPPPLYGNCTPAIPGSPFVLSQLADSVGVLMEVVGIFSAPGEVDAIGRGTFTTQLNQPGINTVAGLLDTLNAPGGSVSATYSAIFYTETAVVPEPATSALVGLGAVLVGIGAIRRRRLQ